MQCNHEGSSYSSSTYKVLSSKANQTALDADWLKLFLSSINLCWCESLFKLVSLGKKYIVSNSSLR